MKRIILLLIPLCFSLYAFACGELTIISKNDNWKYLDDGSNQGAAWYALGFDDGAWASGNGQLGYGDGDEATVLSYGPDPANKYPTTYFRKTFTVEGLSDFVDFQLNILYDDGVIIYINGVEFTRLDMPASGVDYLTYAAATTSGADEDVYNSIVVPVSFLLEGTNEIAVELHQRSASSSDISFDLELLARGGDLIAKGSKWKYLDDGSNQGSAWSTLSFDDSAWSEGNGQLGYGEGDENTVLNYGPDPNSKYPTTYFRKCFNLTDPSAFSQMILNVLFDDGFVLYINGIEVFGVNMPAAVDYLTYANVTVGGADENVYVPYVIPMSYFQAGQNLIAVEVHQRSGTSSDLGFDLEIIGTELNGGGDDVAIALGAEWKYLDDGSNQGTAWYSPSFDDTTWSLGLAELGYGEGDEATVVSYGNDPSNKYLTTYFRKTFEVVNLNDWIFGARLDLLRDDGAVVYLNGNEVYRTNMPAGTISYNTAASATAAEGVFVTEYLTQNQFVQGTNTIAVEIHNRSITSSDISFDLKLERSAAAVVVRGPYLQKGTPTSMILKWRTNTVTDAGVWYGSSPNSLTFFESSPTLSIDHEIELTGLTAATKYYYAVGSSSDAFAGGDVAHYFVTSPLPDAQDPYRLWVLGDCGTANNNQRAVRDAYQNFNGSTHSDMILLLGDNAYNDGLDEEYQTAIFENMYEDFLINSVVWSCPGNHDYYSGADAATQTGTYYDIFSFPKNGEAGGLPSGTEAYYSFDYGNIHIISLDSHDSDRSVNGPMLTWLANDLAANTKDWIIAIWHHPAYTKGSHDSDIESRLIQMRQNALPILEDAGVDLILAGHSHSYERSKFVKGHYGHSSTFNGTMTVQEGSGKENVDVAYTKYHDGHFGGDGAVYITAGSSGKISGGSLNHPVMYASMSTLGSVVVDVEGDRMEVKFVSSIGLVDDYFTITKGANFDPNTDTDNDGVADIEECPTGWPCVDSDGDDVPDIRDMDSDGDLLTDDVDPCRIGKGIQTAAFLEGAYMKDSLKMVTTLNTERQLLPGQTPVDMSVTPTPAGQPYHIAPWNYLGLESITDYDADVVDWVLVSLRTTRAKSTEVWKNAALLAANGEIRFLDACLPSGLNGTYYMVIEHRNHMAVMSTDPLALTNGVFNHDFRWQNSYAVLGTGQLEMELNVWALPAGDFEQTTDVNGPDINANDRVLFEANNGNFNVYESTDVDFSGDTNAEDHIKWNKNNGLSGVVPR